MAEIGKLIYEPNRSIVQEKQFYYPKKERILEVRKSVRRHRKYRFLYTLWYTVRDFDFRLKWLRNYLKGRQ
jgi:hypothetical protein